MLQRVGEGITLLPTFRSCCTPSISSPSLLYTTTVGQTVKRGFRRLVIRTMQSIPHDEKVSNGKEDFAIGTTLTDADIGKPGTLSAIEPAQVVATNAPVPPDGGFYAWLQVAASFCIFLNTW